MTLLLTSLPPSMERRDTGGQDHGEWWQRECVASWWRAGFLPLSVNTAAEMGRVSATLERLGVEGQTVSADASGRVGAPLVYMRDLLRVGLESNADVFCITNADVSIEAPHDFALRVQREVHPGQAWMAQRLDVTEGSLNHMVEFDLGFDFFALHRSDAERLEMGGLVFGQPWWDYTLPLMLLATGARLHRVSGARLLHLRHSIRWRGRMWEHFGWETHRLLSQQPTPPGTQASCMLDTIEAEIPQGLQKMQLALEAAVHLRDLNELRGSRQAMRHFGTACLERLIAELDATEADHGEIGGTVDPDPVRRPSSGVVHVTVKTGHRGNYLRVLARGLELAPVTCRISLHTTGRLLRPRRLLCATLDDQPVAFVAVALLRALIGRSTCGIYLRPHSMLAPWTSGPWRLKRGMFRLVRRLRRVRVVSVIPFTLRPELADICDDWINDPEHWDVQERLESPGGGLPETDLSRAALQHAGDRPLLLVCGWLTAQKGLDDLHVGDGSVAIAVVGAVQEGAEQAVARLQASGAWVVDRWVSDDELLSLYGVADAVWCRYRSDYDQSSGVFGRALQLGIPMIVRPGSLLETWAQGQGVRTLHEVSEVRPCGGRDLWEQSAQAQRARGRTLRVLEQQLNALD